MSEDECIAIAILNIALKRSKESFEKIGNYIQLGNIEQRAIETILDLYKQEKEKSKILYEIIDKVRAQTRLIRFSNGKPYNTPKKEIFSAFCNIQELLKGNYVFLTTEEFIENLIRNNEE